MDERQVCVEELGKMYFGKTGASNDGKANLDSLDLCLSRAYRDMNRTIVGLPKNEHERAEIRDKAQRIIKRRLLSLAANDSLQQKTFDDWHRDTAHSLIQAYQKEGILFFHGQAQKWINMAFKYIYIMVELGIDSGELKNFEPWFMHAHLPIDGNVITELKRRGIRISYDVPWSRNKKPQQYRELQDIIRSTSTLGPTGLLADFLLWKP